MSSGTRYSYELQNNWRTMPLGTIWIANHLALSFLFHILRQVSAEMKLSIWDPLALPNKIEWIRGKDTYPQPGPTLYQNHYSWDDFSICTELHKHYIVQQHSLRPLQCTYKPWAAPLTWGLGLINFSFRTNSYHAFHIHRIHRHYYYTTTTTTLTVTYTTRNEVKTETDTQLCSWRNSWDCSLPKISTKQSKYSKPTFHRQPWNCSRQQKHSPVHRYTIECFLLRLSY